MNPQDQPATKADLDELRNATKTDLADFRNATKADLAEFKNATQAELDAIKEMLRGIETSLLRPFTDMRKAWMFACAAWMLTP